LEFSKRAQINFGAVAKGNLLQSSSPKPKHNVRAISTFLRKFAYIFAIHGAPVSTTATAISPQFSKKIETALMGHSGTCWKLIQVFFSI
jgi:hypothetical protein